MQRRKVPRSAEVETIAVGQPLSPAARWRLHRDLVILIANRAGVSQRVLADVFDLPRSRIAVIIKMIKQRCEGDVAP
jgi:hypothetical protein